jgi:hypothetical protein
MINGFLPVRHLGSAGNLMLTTGILCTFLSLTVGLEGSTTIAKLTPYVGGALLSSVEGLLFSLLFSLLYSIHMERARGVVRSLVCLLDAKYELVTLEVLQVAELLQLKNIQDSLNHQRESQEKILYPKIDGLLAASGKLRPTISEALALESTHIRGALVASLTDFESGWKKSVESTLDTWSSTFADKLDSTILVRLREIMDQSRAVVTALADLERRIETIPQRVDEQASATLSNIATSFGEGSTAISQNRSQGLLGNLSQSVQFGSLAAACRTLATSEKDITGPARTHLPLHESPARESGPRAGGEAVKERLSRRYPATKGSAGGKLPRGKGASRSPRRSLSEASRKAPTKVA